MFAVLLRSRAQAAGCHDAAEWPADAAIRTIAEYVSQGSPRVSIIELGDLAGIREVLGALRVDTLEQGFHLARTIIEGRGGVISLGCSESL